MFQNLLDKIQKFFQGNERSVTVKKNVLYSILIRIMSIAVSFLLVPITLGYVSAELYGVWLTLSSVMTWLTFMDIGFTQGLKNKLTEAIAHEDWDRGKQLVSTTYFMMFVIFIPVGILLGMLAPLVDWCSLLNVNHVYENEVLRVMLVVIGFACSQMIVNVLVSVVAAFQEVALSNSFLVIGNVLSLFVIIVLTKTCPPSLLYLSLVFCSLPVLVTCVASIILFRGRFKYVAPSIQAINTSLVKELFGLGYKLFIINIQVVVLYQSTNILISNISSPLMVTSYNIAYRYLNLAMMLFSIMTAPLWPAYTDAFAKGDYNWMITARNKMIKVFYMSIALSIIMIIVSPFIYHIWVGDEVDVPFVMTLVVAIYVIVYSWSILNGTIIVGLGKLALNARLVWVGMILHVPMSYLLGGFYGGYGVLISMILINLLYACVFHFQTNKLLERKAIGIWNR